MLKSNYFHVCKASKCESEAESNLVKGIKGNSKRWVAQLLETVQPYTYKGKQERGGFAVH